jgi:hypothetical protein
MIHLVVYMQEYPMQNKRKLKVNVNIATGGAEFICGDWSLKEDCLCLSSNCSQSPL